LGTNSFEQPAAESAPFDAAPAGRRVLAARSRPMRVLIRFASGRSALALADQVVVSATNFLTLVLVGRHLPHADFGPFMLAWLAIVFLTNMHRAVISQPMNALGATESAPQLARRIGALLASQSFILAGAVLALAVAAWVYFPNPVLLSSAALFMIAALMQDLLRRVRYTEDRVGSALRLSLTGCSVQLAALLAGTLVGLPSAARAFQLLTLGALLPSLINWAELRQWVAQRAPIRATLTEHTRFGRWLVLTGLAVWFSGQVYPFLLAAAGPDMVGRYAACQSLFQGVAIISQAASNLLPATIARQFASGDERAAWRYCLRAFVVVLLAAAVPCVVLALFGDMLVALLYGPAFTGTGSLMLILSFAALFVALDGVTGSIALARQHPHSLMIGHVVGAAFTLTLGAYLVRSYSIIGAVSAYSGSMAVVFFVQIALLAYFFAPWRARRNADAGR